MNIQKIMTKVVSLMAVAILYVASTASVVANQNDSVILYLNDPLGSAIAAYDENGDVCWEETHTPYGDKTVLDDSFNRPSCGVIIEERGFTGHTDDYETDLVYMQQRYYDPTIGRFLSTDPVGPISGMPETINRYSYAGNNPYKYIDPDGRLLFAVHSMRRDLPPELALQASAAGNMGAVAAIASVAVGATMATPGPEDVFFAAGGATRALSALGSSKRFEVPKAGANNAIEGIYEFTDTAGKKYCGQSCNIPNRLNQHVKSGKLDPNKNASTTEVLGGKTAREIAEHKRIQEITGGVPARFSDKVSNKVDPIGPNRRHLLDD